MGRPKLKVHPHFLSRDIHPLCFPNFLPTYYSRNPLQHAMKYRQQNAQLLHLHLHVKTWPFLEDRAAPR